MNEVVWEKYLGLKDELSERKRIQSFYVDLDEETNSITSPCSTEGRLVRDLLEMLKIATTNLEFFIDSTPQKDNALREALKLLDGKSLKF